MIPGSKGKDEPETRYCSSVEAEKFYLTFSRVTPLPPRKEHSIGFVFPFVLENASAIITAPVEKQFFKGSSVIEEGRMLKGARMDGFSLTPIKGSEGGHVPVMGRAYLHVDKSVYDELMKLQQPKSLTKKDG